MCVCFSRFLLLFPSSSKVIFFSSFDSLHFERQRLNNMWLVHTRDEWIQSTNIMHISKKNHIITNINNNNNNVGEEQQQKRQLKTRNRRAKRERKKMKRSWKTHEAWNLNMWSSSIPNVWTIHVNDDRFNWILFGYNWSNL